VRRDHVGGAVMVLVGALVLAASADLPFGTLASPGAGMLPTIAVVLMMTFAAALVLTGRDSPPMAEIDWGNLGHAGRVAGVTGAAISLYIWLGFIATSVLLLFVLTYFVERKSLPRAAAFSLVAALLAYFVFAILLKAPLPRGHWY
jgi:hypothetical protein